MPSFKWGAAACASAWLCLLILAVACESLLPLPDPLQVDLTYSLSGPSLRHLAGTDELGRDVLSRILNGAQSTLMVTGGATALNMCLALLLGMTAAYRGGIADRLLGLTIDLFWSIPFTVFVILIISIVGVHTWTLVLTIGAVNWVTSARVIRAETKRLRDEDFMRAAQAFGFSPMQLVFTHLFPNLKRTLLALTAYAAIEILTLETGLAFIGLSLPAPEPTWGGLLAAGLSYISSGWWMVAAAAGFITMTLVSLQVLARSIEGQQRAVVQDF
jgi:ABC-type dipeptide/oligopeptide/nickel transport system permease subunit